MSSNRKIVEKKRNKGMLPIIGLFFAVLILGVSYGLSPLAVEGIASINDEWDKKMRQEDDFQTPDVDESEEFMPEVRYLMIVVLWFTLMSLGVMIVSAAIGPDPEKIKINNLNPSPANKKKMRKRMKQDLKQAKKTVQRAKRARK